MTTRQNHQLLSHPAAQHGVAAYWARACLMLLALVIAGCATTNSSATGSGSGSRSGVVTGSSQSSDTGAPTVILRDPAPATLSVSMSVNMSQNSGDAQNMTLVSLSFSQGERIVHFAGNERMTCNGADLGLKDRAATFEILDAPTAQVAGTTVRCDYAAGGAVASVSLRIPSPPALTSPRNGAQVTRGTQTPLTYRVDETTCSIMGIVALAVPTSPQPKSIATLNTPGPLQATIDTSRFASGPGKVVITATLAPHIVASGAPFKSVSAGGSATVITSVTWM